ncbi:MAG: hypothetical protein COB02_03305 [Candidatus Cloacimonadota bacterium]|nr:MAG: hypothetical protein COB02_03305 [Candidatus Cloacimonadota bacterium]
MKYLFIKSFLLLFTISFTSANIIFIEKIDNIGNFREIQNNDFTNKIPVETKEVQRAISGYDLAQKIAFQQNLRKQGVLEPSIQFLSKTKKNKPLYIEIDNGDWAYNIMEGKNLQIIRNKQITRVNKAPIIKIGRNIPNSNDKHFMGETFSHEIGHAVMNALYSGKDLPKSQGGSHTIDSIKSPSFAWIEGFGEYYAASTYGDDKFPRSYNNRSKQELNSSEGYIASILLELDQAFSKEDIFTVIADSHPQSPADFLEQYLSAHPNRSQKIFEIMKKYSNNKWPDQQFILNYQQGNLLILDLDGDQKGIYLAKDPQTTSELEQQKEKVKQSQKEIIEIKNYLQSLSSYLERMYLYKQNLISQYNDSSFFKSLLHRSQSLIYRANQQFNSYQNYLNTLRKKEQQQIEDFESIQDFNLSRPSNNKLDSSFYGNSGKILRY